MGKTARQHIRLQAVKSNICIMSNCKAKKLCVCSCEIAVPCIVFHASQETEMEVSSVLG